MEDLKQKAREVAERGYCVFESVYDAEECARMRAIFAEMRARKGGSMAEPHMLVFHPLLEFGPELAPFYASKPILVDALAEILGDDVRLAHNGGAVFENAMAERYLTSWHHHYGWEIPPDGLQRERPERVLGSVYIDGSDLEVGPLLVLPRELNDPTTPRGEVTENWEGEVAVIMPPGSFVIFDTAVWHASRRGTAATRRHLWGAHYQGWNDPRPHPEDNAADQAQVMEYARESERLRQLVECPAAAP